MIGVGTRSVMVLVGNQSWTQRRFVKWPGVRWSWLGTRKVGVKLFFGPYFVEVVNRKTWAEAYTECEKQILTDA